MWVEPSGWIVTGVGAPVAAVFLVWAALVLQCDRRRWRPLDPLLMALLLESVVQQGTACLHTVVGLFRPDDELWCSGLVWWLAAIRTMQAGTLATLAAGRLIRVRYSHLLYHLACLAVLSSCIGVAAVLARTSPCDQHSDRRYIVFWLTLQVALAVTSLVAVLTSCCRSQPAPGSEHSCFVNTSRHHQRRQLLNSSSDLSSAVSDISMISTMRSRSGRGISHSVSDCSARNMIRGRQPLVEELLRISPVNPKQNPPPVTFLNGTPEGPRLTSSNSFLKGKCAARGQCGHYNTQDGSGGQQQDVQMPCAAILEETKLMTGCEVDTSSYGVSTLRAIEPCYVSTTTSASSTNSRSPCLLRDQDDVSLTAIFCVLLLCYVVNHIPVLCLTVAKSFLPHVIPTSWPTVSIPLWTGMLEGCLLPVVLAMSDRTFVRRIAAVYSRRRPSDMTKPPQGLHGKFRPFNNTLLENHRPLETVRFPITNGSLFTSLDGRIPIIHNYRRSKGVKTSGPLPSYCLNVGVTSRFCHANYALPNCVHQPESGSQLRANIITADINCTDRKSESPLSPFAAGVSNTAVVAGQKDTLSSERPMLHAQCFTQRLSTSDLRKEPPSPFPQNIKELREKLFLENRDSDDDDDDDDDEFEEFDSSIVCDEPIYATLSSRSVCSATTAANDDFEFYHQQESPHNPHLLHTRYRAESARSSPVRCRSVMSRSSSTDRGRTPIPEVLLTDDKEDTHSDDDEERQHRPLYRQQPLPSRRSRLAHPVRPLSKRLGLPPTPPPPRRLAPVLSVDSLVAALHQADISYLDTGDLCRHSDELRAGSVPDLKKVFYTGFL